MLANDGSLQTQYFQARGCHPKTQSWEKFQVPSKNLDSWGFRQGVGGEWMRGEWVWSGWGVGGEWVRCGAGGAVRCGAVRCGAVQKKFRILV